MKESYHLDVYYYVNELAIMCKRSKLRKIVMDIWNATRNIYLIILDDDNEILQFYMGDISVEDLKNYKYKYTGPESVSNVEKLQKSLDELRIHMNYYNSRKEKQGAGGEKDAD